MRANIAEEGQWDFLEVWAGFGGFARQVVGLRAGPPVGRIASKIGSEMVLDLEDDATVALL